MLKNNIATFVNKPIYGLLNIGLINDPRLSGLTVKEFLLKLDKMTDDDLFELMVDEFLTLAKLTATDGDELLPLYLKLVANVESDDTYFDLDEVKIKLKELKGFDHRKVTNIIKNEIRKEYTGVSRGQIYSVFTQDLNTSEISDYFQETDEVGCEYHSGINFYADMSRFIANLLKFIKA